MAAPCGAAIGQLTPIRRTATKRYFDLGNWKLLDVIADSLSQTEDGAESKRNNNGGDAAPNDSLAAVSGLGRHAGQIHNQNSAEASNRRKRDDERLQHINGTGDNAAHSLLHVVERAVACELWCGESVHGGQARSKRGGVDGRHIIAHFTNPSRDCRNHWGFPPFLRGACHKFFFASGFHSLCLIQSIYFASYLLCKRTLRKSVNKLSLKMKVAKK